MGRVPISKFLDLTHEILLRKGEKEGNSWEKKKIRRTAIAHGWVERPIMCKRSV
jgi:hypothetical protein